MTRPLLVVQNAADDPPARLGEWLTGTGVELDVREMFERGLIEPAKLLEYFSAIEPRVYRYPAIDAKSFRLALDDAVRMTSE